MEGLVTMGPTPSSLSESNAFSPPVGTKKPVKLFTQSHILEDLGDICKYF